MIDIALFLLMTAGAIVLLALPFLKRQVSLDRGQFDLTVYEDQLAELDRDLDRGVIDDEAARAAKLEIERRILAIADSHDMPVGPDRHQFSVQAMATAILVLIVPLASGLFYVNSGRPDLPDMPLVSRVQPDQPSGQDALQANIERLEKELETEPDNGNGWVLLARARLQAGLFQEAIEAFKSGMEHLPNEPMVEAELAEAIVYSSGGQVTPVALNHFKALLEKIPNEPRSRYYLGLALAQEGEIDAAIEGWSQLLEVSPSDAPWRPQIVEAVRSVLSSSGKPTEEIIAALPEGTTLEPAESGGITSQQAAIEALPAEKQNEQIRGMVESLAARLEDEPDDIEGWLMLGRSRAVLGEPDAAKAAFERAVALGPERPDILMAYASSLLQPSETPGGDPVVGAEAVGLYQKLVTLAPDDPEPRWLLGLAAAQAGDKEGAIGHWRDLLGLVDESSEDHGVVKARIAALEGDEPAAKIAAGAAPSLARAKPSAAEASPTVASEQQANKGTNGTGPEPTAEDMAEMAALSSDEQNDRIRSMVDGLAAKLEDDPNDVEGWLRLAHSRNVLGEPEAAKDAYRRAMEVEPKSPDVLRAFAASLLGDIHPETKVATVGGEAAGLYRKLIDIEPDDPEAHWYLGLAAIEEGTVGDAKKHWQRVLDLLGPDHPNYAAVQSSLQQVETKTQ